MKNVLFVALVAILAIVTPAFGQANNGPVRTDVNQSNPFTMSGGCLESITFYTGFLQNNFDVRFETDGGVTIRWTAQMNVHDGVGAASGLRGYSATENFTYEFRLAKGQTGLVLPQHRNITVVQQGTGKVFSVQQTGVLVYDIANNKAKVEVTKYSVSCP